MTNSSPDAGQPSKIVIDSDWKSQAQAERERLAAAEQAKPAQTRPAAGAGEVEGDPEGMPEPNFKALIGTLITSALMYMGAFPDPQTGRAMVAPEYAKFHIDLLAVLQEKTKGNLSAEEQLDMDQSLKELRAQFVELMRAVTAMAMKSESQRQGGAAIGGGAGAANVAQMGAQLRGQG